MARLVQPPPKYTPEEWHASNHLQYFNAERERAAAERLRDESFRLAHETEVRTTQTQMDVNKKLEQRITDIGFWKSELDQKQEETEDEISTLLQFKARVEKALADTELPLMIAQQCLVNRERRIKVDLVHDNVEMQLQKVIKRFCVSYLIIFSKYSMNGFFNVIDFCRRWRLLKVCKPCYRELLNKQLSK